MFTQSLIQSLFLSSIEGFSRTRLCSYLRESLRFDYAGTISRHRLQHARLQSVLDAAEQTPMYQQALPSDDNFHHGSELLDHQRLASLRPMTKADFRRHYPTGTFSQTPQRDWRTVSTSGTTDRLSVVADFVKSEQRRS